MNKVNAAIAAMNEYGSKAIPFFFIIDFELERPLVYRLDRLQAEGILYDLRGRRNFRSAPAPPRPLQLRAEPVATDRYDHAFGQVQAHLQRGDSYLLNLTFPSRLHLNYNLREVFENSAAPYKLLFRDRFVVFSPEIFVRIEGGRITSYPMKGTIDAGLPGARRRLLDDPKELAEHYTIVDLIRNDLSMVATDVRVERFRYLDRVQTHRGALLQASSRIAGRLPAGYPARIGELLFRLLPAGSVSGAPKRRTVEIIRAAEGEPRGYYTGVFGYFDGRRLDSAVMIRYIERQADGLYFRSGGGITAMSRQEEEYRELIHKIYVPIAGNHTGEERTPAASVVSSAPL